MTVEPLALPAATVDALKAVSTGTLTTVLLKKGLRNVWLRGTRPLAPGQARAVGRAFTLRFVPAREDLATPASWGSPISTRAAIEAMPPGCVAVFPNDVIVVDQDGAVLAAAEQEQLENWIMGEVEKGAKLPGLYPPDEGNRARYEAWRMGRKG